MDNSTITLNLAYFNEKLHDLTKNRGITVQRMFIKTENYWQTINFLKPYSNQNPYLLIYTINVKGKLYPFAICYT